MLARRAIDANANRAREAARVMEDCARFVLNDSDLSARLKSLRHNLDAALADLPGGHAALVASRDTPNDVGTEISVGRESDRASVRDVAAAAGKRLSEALRAIEEFAKVESPGVASRVERLRYAGYDIEKSLNLALMGGRARQYRLCVLITDSLCTHHDWLEVAHRAIEGGADCLQLREKDMEAAELLARARALVELARPRGVAVFVNDRPDIALLAGADGVHVGQRDLAVRDVRALAGDALLVGVSTTTIEQAERAHLEGADLIGAGPMFETSTKLTPGGRTDGSLAGPAFMRTVAEHGVLRDVPHLAIGGITPANVREVIDAGAKGVAVSSCVCGAEEPGVVGENLRMQLEP
ncbi:MAG: thiamine phosphate synthase [Planctomycetota bacterium]